MRRGGGGWEKKGGKTDRQGSKEGKGRKEGRGRREGRERRREEGKLTKSSPSHRKTEGSLGKSKRYHPYPTGLNLHFLTTNPYLISVHICKRTNQFLLENKTENPTALEKKRAVQSPSNLTISLIPM